MVKLQKASCEPDAFDSFKIMTCLNAWYFIIIYIIYSNKNIFNFLWKYKINNNLYGYAEFLHQNIPD